MVMVTVSLAADGGCVLRQLLLCRLYSQKLKTAHG